ncbi:MAG: ADP-ribosylglycohydrolase family protein [Thermonemataceae bacterium]
MKQETAKDILLGLSIGDALGVPVEFLSRDVLKSSPVTEMIGYGTHQQPAGTWSDDSSLAFCLAESLLQGYSVDDLAEKFVKWYQEAYWTAHGKVFDVGIATAQALRKIMKGEKPLKAGGVGEYDNGNGALMRILPLLLYIKDKEIQERFRLTSEVASITHGHVRSIISCFIYLEYALALLEGKEKQSAYEHMRNTINHFFKEHPYCDEMEYRKFRRVLDDHIIDFQEEEIYATGYVLSTLEASLWCFLTTDNYVDAVLKAVNLGEDTDTVGCVTGGLAGLYYGHKTIPQQWLQQLARKEDIVILAEKLEEKYG